MKIEIKRSIKPVNYLDAIRFLEERVAKVINNEANELIWILEHPSTYTAGKTTNKKDILDKSIDVVETSRGGKVTWHGPGQLICYFVINFNNRKRDIRKIITIVENSIIISLKSFGVNAFNDKKNIGIWVNINNKNKKIGAIGIRIKRWIAYHGFSININNNLSKYKKIIPCGIADKGVSTLKKINNQNYKKLPDKIIKNLVNNLKT